MKKKTKKKKFFMYHVYRVVLGFIFKLYYNPKIIN